MKYILHVDGDAFFASCEVARRPDLKGKPAVVGEERGIASALTYEAKNLGIYRGMPIFKIRAEYPQVAVLSSHFDLYEEYHLHLVEILKKYLPKVESYSIDECFADLPDMEEEEIPDFVKRIKEHVQTSLGITFSFGIAATKTLAKIASKKEKPDGCVFLFSNENTEEKSKEKYSGEVAREIDSVLGQTPIGSVWGIGRQISASLQSNNFSKKIITALDFVMTPLPEIKNIFGQPTIETWYELKGVKIFKVSQNFKDKKSIQSTRMLSKATNDQNILFSELSRNVEVACLELRNTSLYTNAVSFFYRLADDTKHRKWAETMLPVATSDPKIILRELKKNIHRIHKPGVRYKSTGVTFHNLKRKEFIQEDLFGIQERHKEEKNYLEAVDDLNKKFGAWSVMQASSLKSVLIRRGEFIIRRDKDTYEYGLPLPYMGEAY